VVFGAPDRPVDERRVPVGLDDVGAFERLELEDAVELLDFSPTLRGQQVGEVSPCFALERRKIISQK